MLNSLRRLFSRRPAIGDPSALQAWARQRGFEFRRARDAEGCVIDCRLGTQPWRIEWGPSQRAYIEGAELRMLAELDLPRELQLMVLNRQLMEASEKAVYEQYVDDVQTRIDTDTPPEMRWLVMYGRLDMQPFARLRERYVAVGSTMRWLQQWLASPLDEALVATIDQVPVDQPVVLTINRGRLVLRTSMAQPDDAALKRWHALFEHALREALRAGASLRDGGLEPAAAPLTEAPNSSLDTSAPAVPDSSRRRPHH